MRTLALTVLILTLSACGTAPANTDQHGPYGAADHQQLIPRVDVSVSDSTPWC